VRQVVDAVEASLPPGAWPNYVLGNHDEHRIATRVGREQERVAMMLLLTLRGTPTVYYGDEIGMHDAPIPPEREQDPWGKREPGLGLGRDPERTPMQWDAGPNAGFCPPSVTPWLPIADDYREINVAKELDDPRSQLTLTRKLIDLRQSGRALSWGSYRPVDVESDACFLFLRESGGSRVLVALNFTDTPQTVSAPDLGPGRIELSTFLDIESPVDLSALELRPHEGCVISLAG
jgi:alpha-glucosidase